MLETIDWFIVGLYIVLSLGIGVYYTKRASKNVSSYFISGRNLPWWLLGTSMVATTFAADTPLAVTGWVRSDGIWRNWFWWNNIFSHVLIILVFSRLWRRAEVITENELLELRYGGKPAAFLRGFKALYFSTIFNFVVMGWVISAMVKVFKVFFGFETTLAVIICISIAFFYTMMSGLWGVTVNDFVQYFIALFGTIILAFIIINSAEIGGFSQFVHKIKDLDPEHISFFITSSTNNYTQGDFWSSDLFVFLVFVTIIWWSSHNADGGGYFVQRINSAKNEKHALIGTAWFTVNHYIIRFWPWILVAVASLIIYPTANITGGDQEAVYVAVIKEYLGPGLRGLLFVAFLAAFMSTISTQLNWGVSYLINDIYMRFIKRGETDGHYIFASRICTLVLTIMAGLFAFQITNIGKAWIFLWSMSAGIGLVLILRWFWWRINAWSEISALASSLLTSAVLIIFTKVNGIELELKHQIIVVPVSILTWITVTFITKPESESNLQAFYRKVRPWGWWKPIAIKAPEVDRLPLMPVFLNWILGVCFILFAMIGIGKILLGVYYLGIVLVVISAFSGVILINRLKAELKDNS